MQEILPMGNLINNPFPAIYSFSHKFRCVLLTVFLVLIPAGAIAITLEECIETALKMNPGLEAAAYRVKAARSAHQKAQSTWYPNITASGNYSRTDNPAQAFMMELNQERLDFQDPNFDITDPGDTQNIRLSLAMEYLLFDGGRSRLTEQMAEQKIEMSNYARTAARNDLVYEVTKGYYDVLKAGDFVTVFRETAASIEKSLNMARERFQEGTVVKTDVLNLEVQLAQAQEDLIRAENSVHLAVAALNTAIGADIVQPDALLPPLQGSRPLLSKSRRDQSIEQRPELQAAALLAKTRKLDIKESERGYLPTMTAFGSMDMDSRDADNFEESYIFGVKAGWNLFDGFARSGDISEARARRNEALAHLKKTRQQLELDLKEAELQVSNTFQRLKATRKAIESAEESLYITRERYENGAIEITALLNAQSAMTSSAARNRAAYYEYLEALANLDRATGKQWNQ